jgi:hypothetical protein
MQSKGEVKVNVIKRHKKESGVTARRHLTHNQTDFQFGWDEQNLNNR